MNVLDDSLEVFSTNILKLNFIGLDKQNGNAFSYPSVLTYVLGAQKNRLIETVLLSTHNICFG